MTCERIDQLLSESGIDSEYWYCIASAQLGLGNCQCRSHGYFGRYDGGSLSPEDTKKFLAVIYGESFSGNNVY